MLTGGQQYTLVVKAQVINDFYGMINAFSVL